MNTIIGKQVYSRIFGEGIIISENDGIIYVDFINVNKKNVCFHATASFLGNSPYLTTKDKSVLEYLQHQIKKERDIQRMLEVSNCMHNLGISSKHINEYFIEGRIYIYNGYDISEITIESNKYLFDAIKWFEQKNDSKVYAVVPVPECFSNNVFTYALLLNDSLLTIRGNIVLTYAFFLNPNISKAGENKPLCLHIANSGIWTLPEEFNGTIMQLLKES